MHPAVAERFHPLAASSCPMRMWSACRWYTIGQDCSHATNNWGRYLKPPLDGAPSSQTFSRSSFRLGPAASTCQPAHAVDPPQPGQGEEAVTTPDAACSESAAEETTARGCRSPMLLRSVSSATPNYRRTTEWLNQTAGGRTKTSPCSSPSQGDTTRSKVLACSSVAQGDTTREADQHQASDPAGAVCAPVAAPVVNSSGECIRPGSGGAALQPVVPVAVACSSIIAGGRGADEGALLRTSWSNPASLVSALHGRAASLNGTRAFWKAQEGAAARMVQAGATVQQAQGAVEAGGIVGGSCWGTPREDESRSLRPQRQQQPMPDPATPPSSRPGIGQQATPDSLVDAVMGDSDALLMSSSNTADRNGGAASRRTTDSPFLSACSSFYSSHSDPSGTPDSGHESEDQGGAFSPSLPGVRSSHCHRYASRAAFHTPATSSLCEGAYCPMALSPFTGFGDCEASDGMSPAVGETPYARPASAEAVSPNMAGGSRERRMDLGAFAGPNGDLMVPSFLSQWRSGRGRQGRRGAQRDLLDVTGQYGCSVQ